MMEVYFGFMGFGMGFVVGVMYMALVAWWSCRPRKK